MKKWRVTVSEYKSQFKVGIPLELVRLAGIRRSKYVEMSLDSNGKIIMEAVDEKFPGKIKSERD